MLFKILSWALYFVGSASLFVFIVVTERPLWRPRFLGLLRRSWRSLMRSSGTTTLGFILFTLVIPAAFGLLYTTYVRFLKSMPWESTFDQSIIPLLFSLAAVWAVVSVAYVFALVGTVFNDHQYFIEKTKELPVREKEIQDLTARLDETCYNPDRTLTERQRTVLYAALRLTAQKYNYPHIVTGFFEGDTESQRYWYKIYMLFKDAGFVVESEPVRKPQRKNSTDPPDLGFRDGLSISIESNTPPTSDHPRQQLRMAILQDFNDSGIRMQQYPVGAGSPSGIDAVDNIMVWIGIKKVDWVSTMSR